MFIYLLLAAGLFMGWSLGTNDAANAFGTAVATRVVKYRTAVTIIAIMVLLGAAIAGHHNIGKLASIATHNEVVASPEDVESAVNDGTLSTLRLKSALKAFIIFACAGITVFAFYGCLSLSKQMIKLTVWSFKRVARLFSKKEVAK